MKAEADAQDSASLLRQRGLQSPPPRESKTRQIVLMGLVAVGVFLFVSATWRVVDSKPTVVESLRRPVDPFMANLSVSRSMPSVVNVRIPRIIHQTWNSTEDIPERLQPYMRSWADNHPGWQYVFWTRNDTLDLIKNMYPRYQDAAKRLSNEAFDEMARYAILHYFGGVYVDPEFESKYPIDELNRDYEIFIAKEPLAQSVLLDNESEAAMSTKLMGSISRHQFWLHLMEAIKARHDSGKAVPTAAVHTGSKLLKEVYDATKNTAAQKAKVLDPEYFFPTVAFWRVEEMLGVCAAKASDDQAKKDACAWLNSYSRGQFTDNTRAVYHWPCVECVRHKEARDKRSERNVTLWKVLELSNGAGMVSFRPRFYRSASELHQVELKFNTFTEIRYEPFQA